MSDEQEEFPFKIPNGPLERYVGWTMERNRVLVTHGQAGTNRMLIWTVVNFLMAFGLIALAQVPGWVGGLARCFAGGVVGFAATLWMQRAQAYRSGWLEGRVDAMRLVRDAHAAGVPPREALFAMQVHDAVFVLGLGGHVPDDTSGLE